MAARKKKAAGAGRRSRRRPAEPASRGLSPAEMAAGESAPEARDLARAVEAAGGCVLARYRDPLAGAPLLLAALPLASVAPTPFQRDLSEAHARRLQDVIERVGVFLDPLIAVPAPEGGAAAFWSPNGYHRLTALQRLGARSVTALVSPDPALAYRILALNTEKAHATKERALEAMRMARGLAEVDPARRESEFALELEDGSLVTLGLAYEEHPRFAGGAYAATLRASDHFLERPLGEALEVRGERARRLLEIDLRVGEIVAELKRRGFESPYLRNFVVARIRPFRPRGRPALDPDALLDHMQQAAAKFDPGRIRGDQIARAAGGEAD
jgi:ParB family chromosome partitioning protein